MAAIHDWCGRLDDPAGLRCPCKANTVTAFEVEVRVRKAIRTAHARGWVDNASDHPPRKVIGEHFGKRTAA